VSQYAPNTHQAKQGTPTMGGIIVIVGFIAAAWALAVGTSTPIASSTIALFIGFAAIGFLDDFIVPRTMKGKRGLGWKQKFILQAIIAGICVYYHCGQKHDMRWAIITFVVMFIANAYNFVDGLDALAGSILLTFGTGVLILSLAGIIVPESALIATALIAAVIPFLYLNAPPAKVFMGDVGSLPIGAVLGLAVANIASPPAGAFSGSTDGSILQQWLSQQQIEGTMWRPEMLVPLGILCTIMYIELLPVPIQIAWVKLFKKRIFPFTPIHHAFEKAGWPETRVVWMFMMTQLVCVALAIYAFRGVPTNPHPNPPRNMQRLEASPRR
jgi:phospho-N-acetylmuramoyl-pentapeptide-transferase